MFPTEVSRLVLIVAFPLLLLMLGVVASADIAYCRGKRLVTCRHRRMRNNAFVVALSLAAIIGMALMPEVL